MIVMKFGGTSVQDAAVISQVVDILEFSARIKFVGELLTACAP